jgi:hypothetical protein
MATSTRPAKRATSATEPEPIDTTNWPPMSDTVRAAHLRMLRDPHVFDGYDPDAWVAFSGETIVASASTLDELHQILDAQDWDDVLIVQVEPVGLFGG